MSALKFLYSDDALFVLDKPAGLHSVDLPKSKGNSLASLLLAEQPELAQVSQKAEDAGLVQRLDFDTSGCILGARNASCWNILFQELKILSIAKTYLVLLEGRLSDQTFRSFLGNKKASSKKVKNYISKPPTGVRALAGETTFKTLAYNSELNISLVKASASLARRHQIRAHSSYLKAPLLGDELYGSERKLQDLLPDLGNRGFFLHAQTLSFTHPMTNKAMTIEAPTPEALNGLFPGWGA